MFQKVTIIGRLGQDPKTSYTPDGTPVCNFSVATSNNYTNNGKKVEETTWFNVAAWRRQAETCQQYLQKGSLVYIEGQLTGTKIDKGANERTGAAKKTVVPRVWTGQDGNARAAFELKANFVKFLSRNNNGNNGQAQSQPQQKAEIPF